MTDREHFDFYRVHRDIIELISHNGDETELQLRRAIDDYMLNGREPDFATEPKRSVWNQVYAKLLQERNKRIAGRLGGMQSKY